MALYSDKWWLLSHINHSFVMSDDTGNSELVMTSREAKDLKERVLKDAEKEGTLDFVCPLSILEEADDFQAHSFEIRFGRNQLGYHHRPRCNTEIKLEKLKRERKNLPKYKTIHWKEGNFGSVDNINDLFPRNDLDEKKLEKILNKHSTLSHQLETVTIDAHNPFEIYKRFDGGSTSAKERVRTLNIFLGIAEIGSAERNYPMVIQVAGDAKVQEVIGFSCWIYANQNRQPPLKPNVDSYALFMAESDGSIETEFPPLDKRDVISKFGFNYLGLMDIGATNQTNGDASCNQRRVTVTLPDGTFSLIELESRDIALKDIIVKAFGRHKVTTRNFKFNYNIEKSETPGIALDKESLLSGYETNNFHIVRENSKRKTEEEQMISSSTTNTRLKPQMSVLDAKMYKEYIDIQLCSKILTKTDVVMCISEDRLEIYPKQEFSSAMFWKRQKSVSYLMEEVLACEIVSKKFNAKWTLKIVCCTDHIYKKHEFECSDAQANEIETKLNLLLDLKQSDARKEYLAYKEKKRRKD